MRIERLAFTVSTIALAVAAPGLAFAQAVPVTQPPTASTTGPATAGTPEQAPTAPDQSAVPQPVAPGAPDDADLSHDVVVTGSSLRGVAPVGSNLVTVGRAQLEEIAPQTLQQVLKTVPAVTGLQSAGQGAYGSADGSGSNAPTIHGLGASASNSTLVLINGHRFPLTGLNHALGDPNIIAPLAVERVEVLADGASSVYGSDAVAGVINFITRRKYDGIDGVVQRGFGRDYHTLNVGLLGGKSWDSGSFLVSYNFSDRSRLAAANRSYVQADQRRFGGLNFANFNCSPATIVAGGLVYYSPYTAGSGVANNAAANGTCAYTNTWDIVPSERRHNLMATLRQEVGEKLTLTADIVYSDRRNRQNVSRGSASATIFGPGAANAAQINPFYTLPGGVAATSETINFDADQLYGPGAYIAGEAEDFYGTLDAQYRLTSKFNLNLGIVVGKDDSRQFNSGQLNASAFNLAVNGTTNGGGSLTAVSIPGTSTIVLNTPLTTANAFNPYVIANNPSSATTLARLVDNNQTLLAHQTLTNVYGKIDGELFRLPGGAVKIAVGGEYLGYTLRQDLTRANNTGPASTGSTTLQLNYRRDVESAYVEALFPLLGPDQRVPLIYSFDLNLSGRYDHYSDFGDTKNPKIAANWVITPGIKLRGNFAKSFVAPALTSRGSNAAGLTGESSFAGTTGSGLPGGAVTVSTALFPGAIGLPGCPAGSTSCVIGSNITGVLLNGGNAALQPQRGTAYSFGVDFTPHMLPGFRLGVTYWTNKLRGGITSPVPALALGASDLSSLIQFYPTGASAAQIAAASAGLPQTAALPATTYFIYNYQQKNVLNLDVAGIDVSANYEVTTDVGHFSFGAGFTEKTKFDQFFGATGQRFSVLGTAGFNTTFPSVRFEGRFNVGFQRGGFNINTYYNILGGYRNYSGSTQVPLIRANGVPVGGGAPVASFRTMDLNIAYTIKDRLFLKQVQVFVDATNLFDRDPPFYSVFTVNGATAYDSLNASPIGRLVTLGLRTKF